MRSKVLKEYIPRSWFHPKGVLKVVEKLKPRLPDVNGSLFLTLTLDRAYFHEQWMGPSEAYDFTRSHIRKIFYKLRKGVKWKGKTHRINSPYCIKVEFHDDPEGWPHFHIILLTRKNLPSELLATLWGYGRTNIKRITNKKFNYILKYVSKSNRVPKWVRRKNRIRIFQSSKGFLTKLEVEKPIEKAFTPSQPRKQFYTIGERVDSYSKSALVIDEHLINGTIRYRQIQLKDYFKNLLDRLVYSIAQDGRYLGDGKIKINNQEEFYPWIKTPNQQPKP